MNDLYELTLLASGVLGIPTLFWEHCLVTEVHDSSMSYYLLLTSALDSLFILIPSTWNQRYSCLMTWPGIPPVPLASSIIIDTHLPL